MIHIWDHVYGNQNNGIVMCKPMAIPESYEEMEMIDAGWLALDQKVFYEGRYQECFFQCRSTRINLKKYKEEKLSKYKGKKIQMMEIRPEQHNVEMTGLRSVYQKYLKRNCLPDNNDPFKVISDRDSFLIYYVQDVTNIIGFTKIKRYWFQEELLNYNSRKDLARLSPDQCYAVHTVFHANTIAMEHVAFNMESAWAKKKGMGEIYLGPGYGKTGIQKSKIPGFQWWTGTEWSSNRKSFEKICERDSKITKVKELDKL